MNWWSKIKAGCMQCYFRAGYNNRLYLRKILSLCKLTHTFLCHYCTTSFWEHILNNSWSSDSTTLSASRCLCGVHFLQWNYCNLGYLSQIYLSSKTQMPFNSYITKSKEVRWELKCSCPLAKSSPVPAHGPSLGSPWGRSHARITNWAPTCCVQRLWPITQTLLYPCASSSATIHWPCSVFTGDECNKNKSKPEQETNNPHPTKPAQQNGTSESRAAKLRRIKDVNYQIQSYSFLLWWHVPSQSFPLHWLWVVCFPFLHRVIFLFSRLQPVFHKFWFFKWENLHSKLGLQTLTSSAINSEL